MKRLAVLLISTLAPSFAWSAPGDFFLDPRGAVGFNPAQGTYFMLGLDVGMEISENLRAGVGGYFSAGEEPRHDREYGVGPFASYVLPLTSFLMASARQEINYVNLYDPVKIATPTGTEYDHIEEEGYASVTSAALHIFFTSNFVLSGGYRLVIGLDNEALDDGRSGAFVGLSLGF